MPSGISPLPHQKPRLGAILLAAGSSRRMGGPNKLLAKFDGQPLIRRIGENLLAAGLEDIVLVTGRDSSRVGQAMAGLPIDIVYNQNHETGLGSSLKAGVRALAQMDGVLVMLGDMPKIAPDHINLLADAFFRAKGHSIIRASTVGRPGNPVILPKALFAAIEGLEGDKGARALIEQSGIAIVDVEIGEAALFDIDTPEALKKSGGLLP